MPGFSLSNNRSPERVIARHFPVENQLNFSSHLGRAMWINVILATSLPNDL